MISGHRFADELLAVTVSLQRLSDTDHAVVQDVVDSERQRDNAGVMCLARRRCDVILAMLRNQQPYLAPARREAQAGIIDQPAQAA